MIDPLRHLTVFSPHAFGQKRVDVIGAGATGSRVVLGLAKLGVENIHVWDFDTVVEHNLANQLYGLADIGKLKVEALRELVRAQTGTEVSVHPERVNGSQALGEIVFLLTDTMASRREIWEGALKFKLRTKLVVETRMGADSGRIYVIDPSRPQHIRRWEQTLCSDDETEVSACGASTSVGATADIVSGLAVWQMIRWFSITRGEEDELDNELLVSLRSTMVLSQKF